MPKTTNEKIDPYKVYLRNENRRLKRVYEQECRRQERVCNESDQKILQLDWLLARRVDQKIHELDQLLSRRARFRSIVAQRIRELEEELQNPGENEGDQNENKD